MAELVRLQREIAILRHANAKLTRMRNHDVRSILALVFVLQHEENTTNQTQELIVELVRQFGNIKVVCGAGPKRYFEYGTQDTGGRKRIRIDDDAKTMELVKFIIGK